MTDSPLNDADAAGDSLRGANSSPGLIRTYSLAEVASVVLPPEMKLPELWLKRRLLRGEITGYKVGRVWRMTAQDVESMVESLRNIPNPGPQTDLGEYPGGLTRRAWQRRQRR
jgi:hypothetical protein